MNAHEAVSTLIVTADDALARHVSSVLEHCGYRPAVTAAADLPGMQQACRSAGFPSAAPRVLLCDLTTPRLHAGDLLTRWRRLPDAPAVVMISRHPRLSEAVSLMRLGAADYLVMPVRDDQLVEAVDQAHEHHSPLVDLSLFPDPCETSHPAGMIGHDIRMQRIYDMIDAVAPSRTTVLLTGESGTGKSLVARAVHEASPRRDKPMITFACGAVPESLLEAELFGYVKGAFTGADRDKPGRLASAEGGTLFLDEINSASPAVQLRLLRVLQERTYEPVGSSESRQCDVRFILASNQCLHALVNDGMFRQDLFYRINVVNIAMPALRDRREDIPALANHFLELYCQQLGRHRRLTPQALSALQRYDWPGNVRELENVIERGVVLSRDTLIETSDLGAEVSHATTHAPPARTALSQDDPACVYVPALQNGWTPTPLEDALAEPQRQIILRALEANDFNRQATAQQLGIDRTTLYKKIKRLGLETP